MDESPYPRNRKSILTPNWVVGLTLYLLAIGVFLVLAFSTIVHGYWIRLVLACVCVCIIGFIEGASLFTKRVWDDPLANWSPFPKLVILFALAAGGIGLRGDLTIQSIFAPAVVIPFLLFNAVSIHSFLAGMKYYRRMFPKRPSEENK